MGGSQHDRVGLQCMHHYVGWSFSQSVCTLMIWLFSSRTVVVKDCFNSILSVRIRYGAGLGSGPIGCKPSARMMKSSLTSSVLLLALEGKS